MPCRAVGSLSLEVSKCSQEGSEVERIWAREHLVFSPPTESLILNPIALSPESTVNKETILIGSCKLEHDQL